MPIVQTEIFEKQKLKTVEPDTANVIEKSSDNTALLNPEQQEQHTPNASHLLGNRLGGNGWSGWSSQFEEDENDGGTADKLDNVQSRASKEDFNSFDSLLKVYGNKTETLSIGNISYEETLESPLPDMDVVENENSNFDKDSELLSRKVRLFLLMDLINTCLFISSTMVR